MVEPRPAIAPAPAQRKGGAARESRLSLRLENRSFLTALRGPILHLASEFCRFTVARRC